MISVLPWGLSLLLWVNAAPSPTKESLYLKATTLVRQQRYAEALPVYQQVLPILQREKRGVPRSSRRWSLLTLGQGYTLRQVAKLHDRLGQKRKACFINEQIHVLYQTLPQNWEQYASTNLRKEIRTALQQRKGVCQTVPSVIQVRTQPSNAILEQQEGGIWKLATKTLTTTANKLKLRVTAKGYQPLTRTIPVPRWTSFKVEWKLKPKPRPRYRIVFQPAPPRKAPVPIIVTVKPKATPFYKTWWFWTVTGTVIAGATAAAIIAATAQPKHVLDGEQQGQPHKLW